jgi:hypothetical protein
VPYRKYKNWYVGPCDSNIDTTTAAKTVAAEDDDDAMMPEEAMTT